MKYKGITKKKEKSRGRVSTTFIRVGKGELRVLFKEFMGLGSLIRIKVYLKYISLTQEGRGTVKDLKREGMD